MNYFFFKCKWCKTFFFTVKLNTKCIWVFCGSAMDNRLCWLHLLIQYTCTVPVLLRKQNYQNADENSDKLWWSIFPSTLARWKKDLSYWYFFCNKKPFSKVLSFVHNLHLCKWLTKTVKQQIISDKQSLQLKLSDKIVKDLKPGLWVHLELPVWDSKLRFLSLLFFLWVFIHSSIWIALSMHM